MKALPQRSAPHPEQGLDDDCQNGSLCSEEKRGKPRGLLKDGVEARQHQDDKEARQYKQQAGNEAAAHAVHQPADIGGQLLSLRARQQHAEIQSVQEALLGNPALLIDNRRVHQGDLTGRPAEAQAADARPYTRRLPKCRYRYDFVRRDRFVHGCRPLPQAARYHRRVCAAILTPLAPRVPQTFRGYKSSPASGRSEISERTQPVALPTRICC